MFVTPVDFGTPAHAETVRLRHKVIHQPLNVEVTPDSLSQEYQDVHFALYAANCFLLGCAVLRTNAQKPSIAHLRQVSIRQEYQRKGLGAKLIKAIERHALGNNFKQIHLLAHKGAVPFYASQGFKRYGNVTRVAGLKHYSMRKKLAK